LQAVAVALDRWVVLGVGAFQIAVRHQAGTAVARADYIDHVQIIVFNQTIEMHINKIQSGGGAPMAE